MTREEKAHSLGQMYFPDDQNIWARPNYEAKFVSDACMQMAEWECKRLVKEAREWLRNNIDFYIETKYDEDFRVDIEQLLNDISKAMEE
jgi:hypothetical protein